MRLAVTLLVAAALGAGIGQSQDPKQPPIRTQANYVRVDVYPMSNGRPVQDLRVEDFEVLEDGAPQAIQNFEHIVISPGGPQAQRVDPTTVEASRQAIANPRSRLFVIFLDVNNVSVEGTWNVREPLIKLVDRILGPDDLTGIMTPEMSPAQIAFARKTEVFERAMRDRMPWGTRHTLHLDPREKEYQACYPPLTQEVEQGMLDSELFVKMKARRRERMTLDALRDLSLYVRNLREERTAVIAVSEGWLLFRPDPEMTKLRVECSCLGTRGDPKTCRGCELVGKEQIPGIDPIGVGPGGKLGRGGLADAPHRALQSDCDRERMGLAQMDNDLYFRTLLDDANRANVSFYPVDPRGLAAWDAPLGPEPPPTMLQDQANLKSRREAMFNMAAATDGIAVMTSNDLDPGLKRVADDLTSYYLLGYYSTNAKLDGRFRKITVRVKRPGVDVRARRGYRAPTEAEVAAAAASAPLPPASAEETARNTAMDALARIRPEARFRIYAIYAADGGDNSSGTSIVWVAGELQPPAATDPWTKGGTADIDVTAGGTTTTAKVTLAPGERAFLTSVTLPKPIAGAFDVRARLTGADTDAARLADSIHVPLTAGSRQPLLFRRGPATGNRVIPAATFLFSRTERMRVEIPAPADAKPGSGRMLDRAGQPLPVPVVVGEKTDEAGRRWIVADVTLAPLGAGDYVIELSFTAGGSKHKTLTAIRVGR